ncbi:MAG TPA: hypothetical protein VGC00_09995 [Thermoanaerobaculia bacterium]
MSRSWSPTTARESIAPTAFLAVTATPVGISSRKSAHSVAAPRDGSLVIRTSRP